MYRVLSRAVSGHKPHTKLKIKVRKIRANVDLPQVCLFINFKKIHVAGLVY